MARMPISKKIRFEVFKRDNFTCQYCGKSSPEVILEVDHIIPVSNCGDNNIENLVTSCRDCNKGKFKNELPKIVIEKIQAHSANQDIECQIQNELNAKLKNLEIRKSIFKNYIQAINIYVQNAIGRELKEDEIKDLLMLIDGHGFNAVFDACEAICNRINFTYSFSYVEIYKRLTCKKGGA